MQQSPTQTPNEQKKPLTFVRSFQAPRERVWQALSDPEALKQWWGPREFTTPVYRIDFREGGSYLSCMFSPTGQEYWSTGTFLEIDPPERILMTDSFADEDGNVVYGSYYGMDAGFPLKSIVEYRFEEAGDSTRLIMTYDDVSGLSESDLEGMKEGWNESLDKLDEYLTKDAGPACEI